MDYKIEIGVQARKDSRKLEHNPLKAKVLELLSIVSRNPFQNPPPYEKMIHEGEVVYSRRINIQHRLV